MFLNGRLHAEEMSNRGWVHFEVIRTKNYRTKLDILIIKLMRNNFLNLVLIMFLRQ